MRLTENSLRKIIREEISLLEYSKNDPIPEVNRQDKNLAIFLLGPPGSGKGTFYREFILPKQRNIRTFNADDISNLRTNDPLAYAPGSSELSKKYVSYFVQTGQNFVYDLTGNTFNLVKPVYDLARENGYNVIFIHLLIPVQKAKRRISQRNLARTQPKVDMKYLQKSYKSAQRLISQYAKLNPDNYYVIVNTDDEYQFMRYDNGKMLVRKNDKYVPR